MSPTRMCAGCRERAPQAELVRLVARPAGDGAQRISLDGPGPRGPGRGAYLHRTYACWQAAARRRAVERGLRIRSGATDLLACWPESWPGTEPGRTADRA